MLGGEQKIVEEEITQIYDIREWNTFSIPLKVCCTYSWVEQLLW